MTRCFIVLCCSLLCTTALAQPPGPPGGGGPPPVYLNEDASAWAFTDFSATSDEVTVTVEAEMRHIGDPAHVDTSHEDCPCTYASGAAFCEVIDINNDYVGGGGVSVWVGNGTDENQFTLTVGLESLPPGDYTAILWIEYSEVDMAFLPYGTARRYRFYGVNEGFTVECP